MDKASSVENPNCHTARRGERRRTDLRLKAWNYENAGHYFVTFATSGRSRILGKVVPTQKGAKVELSLIGRTCLEAALRAESSCEEIRVRMLVIMPDHVHAIIGLSNGRRNGVSLSEFVRRWKGLATHMCRAHGVVFSLWQKSFYDRIIRDACEEENIAKYIEQNPLRWLLKENGTDF